MLTTSTHAAEFLKEELARRIETNPRYSLRAFARQLGVSPGELSEVIHGKRKLSPKSVLKISRALGFSAEEAQQLLFLAQGFATPDEGKNTPSARLLSMDLFEVVAQWHCFAILNLMDCVDFKSSAAWIAKRLGISISQVELGLARLERIGMIEKEGKAWRAVKDFVFSPTGIPSEAIRKYHRDILDEAKKSLDVQNVEERQFSGTGFALDPKFLPKIRKDIERFRDELIKRYSSGRKTEVYHLEIALFRLTQAQSSNPVSTGSKTK